MAGLGTTLPNAAEVMKSLCKQCHDNLQQQQEFESLEWGPVPTLPRSRLSGEAQESLVTYLL